MTAALLEIAGRVQLRPGARLPTIAGTRPTQAARLLVGRPAGALPELVGALFALCAPAHRFTARRALDAALGLAAGTSASAEDSMRMSTARDQLLRIGLDWPRLLPGGPDVDLQVQEALAHAGDPAELDGWLSTHWLGERRADWLAAHAHDPAGWAAHWAQRCGTALARLLRPHADPMRRLAAPLHALRLDHHGDATLLAQRIADDPRFCARPDWHGIAAETGPWTRAVDRGEAPADNAWMRLIARLVDLLRLIAPGGERRLAHGALRLGDGASIAWTEMARGLLVHRIVLEPSPQGPRIADCRVLAPTDWNFHPRGVLAQALCPLDGPDRLAQAARAAVAFDPCVGFDVEDRLESTETAHA